LVNAIWVSGLQGFGHTETTERHSVPAQGVHMVLASAKFLGNGA